MLGDDSSILCRKLTFSEIQVATHNFDESLVIGHGGFGKVYKGIISNDESLLLVAIKRLDSNSNQGALEFWAEVKMLSTLRHCHLVTLIGFCNDGKEMILVYEYMSRGTLEHHLHNHGNSLSWVQRLKICIGAARGLDYLHTGTGIKQGVIHRDVKTSNILLHNTWEAKISDFGLSKICPKSQPSTYVNTFVKGTFGYLDPNYFYTDKLTRKSDVYAFGVVLFEVLSRKRAVDTSLDEEHWGLARWAQDSIKEGRLKQIVDTNITERISHKCLKGFAQLANRCLHSHPKQRPTMAEIVAGLECVLALQEKANNTLGMTLFGRKVLRVVFPSNGENTNSDGGGTSDTLKLYLDTLSGESGRLVAFDFDTISIATKNFSQDNKISSFPLDFVYKGRLQNGQDIAVARPCNHFKHTEYMNATSKLVKIEHENLVHLLGYCIVETNLHLVYELATHGSLEQLLFDPMCSLLDWNKRYKILLGVARVLVYLHEHAPIRMVHCNVRPAVILLNESLDPKLSGFGLAMAINETDCIYMDRVTGAIGYMAPEYLSSGKLSTKADVFSFGVSVLETICGQRQTHLEELVVKNWLQGTNSNLVDPRIEVDSSLMRRFIEIGLLCVQTAPADRPTMEEVVGMLVGNSSTTLAVEKMRTRMSQEYPYCIKVLDDYDSSAVEDFMSDLCPR